MNIFSPSLDGHVVDLAQRYALSIFPTLVDVSAVAVNLDALARGLRARPEARSPLLDPNRLDRLLSRLHRRWQAGYSFGGYVEDRREIWRGSYLNEDAALHLGIDVNVPAHTPITLLADATAVVVEHDPNQDGGWGGAGV